ncbi:CBS domain-containing protein [Desulfoprunum benzoelyticum]|uniref:CBS-domain-containing membrane protein n=1 Tax=Desulfoprunum benzoelyticum TaxID=1506996 RepID=A0A840V5S3_9BACT|nr:CBS domain-containing protein [Desulfoprunum benzoelyticum]MBB5349099.1 CBS-domain-containing membrane protein [Desulfoprunum benzoelyticum]MBM9530662.1 CBS domain-containing protein [Desulfoprunum benzoelyticum]
MTKPEATHPPIEIAEPDVIAAMRKIEGYIDISPGDFKEIYQLAFDYAVRRLRDSITARDIMTAPVQCIDADMDLQQAAQKLADKVYSGAPVVDGDGKIVGVISEKDFLARMGLVQPATFLSIIAHCLSNKGCMAIALRNHQVRELMTAPAVTAGPEITIGEISRLFIDRKINRLPIVDPDGRPLGIVTRTDLVQSYGIIR